MPLPNFFVIGSARSGTTSLYYLLGSHPQIYLTPTMEPRFFAFEGDPMRFCGPGDDLLARRVTTGMAAYRALFDDVRDEPAIGEITPVYLTIPTTADRIRHHCPDARIVAVLRNPIERAISSFRLERLDGFEPLDSLSDALRAEEARRRAGWSYVWGYRARGYYHAQLTRYFDRFPRSAISVHLYEDWFAPDPLPLRILAFLGLPPHIGAADMAIRHNHTGKDRFAERGGRRFEPSAALIADLRDGYRDDILRLGDLIDRDLSSWLAC